MYLRADVLEQQAGAARPDVALRCAAGRKETSGTCTVRVSDVDRRRLRRGRCAPSRSDYGRQIIPWGINRSIRRATGHTYEELYEGWKAYLDTITRAECAGREARHARRRAPHPSRAGRRKPALRAPRREEDQGAEELLYFRDEDIAARLLPIAAGRQPRPRDRTRARHPHPARGERRRSPATGQSSATRSAITKRIYAFNDSVISMPPGVESPSGTSPNESGSPGRERAQEPDVSPDGTQVVFTENHRGTTTLVIAERHADGELSPDARALVPSARFEQAYTPRFSPDGKWVTYSAWTAEATATSASSRSPPASSPRSRTTARRTGAQLLARRKAHLLRVRSRFGHPQHLRVRARHGQALAGHQRPDRCVPAGSSPDGKTLVYVGYTSYGYDLFALKIDPQPMARDAPTVDTRPDPPTSTISPSPAAIATTRSPRCGRAR